MSLPTKEVLANSSPKVSMSNHILLQIINNKTYFLNYIFEGRILKLF